jgi:hypothetical protein
MANSHDHYCFCNSVVITPPFISDDLVIFFIEVVGGVLGSEIDSAMAVTEQKDGGRRPQRHTTMSEDWIRLTLVPNMDCHAL